MNGRSLFATWAVLVATVFVFASCGVGIIGDGSRDASNGNDTDRKSNEPPALALIVVSPPSATVEIGATQVFEARPKDQYGDPFSATIAWESDRPSIGTITSSGVFLGVAKGETTVVARSGDVSGTAAVTVQTPQCQPKSCAELSAECGEIDDSCGNPLDCGPCVKPLVCGLSTPNRCEEDSQGTFSFFVIGDTRSSPDQLQVNAKSMIGFDPKAAALFNSGDLTASGTTSEWEDHHAALAGGAPDPTVPKDTLGIERQSRFRTDVSTWGDYVRYIGAIGNHDVSDGSWFKNWNNYMIGQKNLGVNSTGGIYFSLTYQNALFIVLDSQHPSTPQTAWLRGVLESPEAQQATWKFAFFHAPVYPCNDKSPFDAGLAWVELFELHKLDIAFVAHSHTFERTCPMLKGRCATGGVIYHNTSAGAVAARSVVVPKTDSVSYGGRTDNYSCSEILDAYRGDWRNFSHFIIQGRNLSSSTRSHNNAADVKDSYSLQKP